MKASHNPYRQHSPYKPSVIDERIKDENTFYSALRSLTVGAVGMGVLFGLLLLIAPRCDGDGPAKSKTRGSEEPKPQPTVTVRNIGPAMSEFIGIYRVVEGTGITLYACTDPWAWDAYMSIWPPIDDDDEAAAKLLVSERLVVIAGGTRVGVFPARGPLYSIERSTPRIWVLDGLHRGRELWIPKLVLIAETAQP